MAPWRSCRARSRRDPPPPADAVPLADLERVIGELVDVALN